MDTFITGNRQIVTLVKRKQRFKRSPSPWCRLHERCSRRKRTVISALYRV
jgi:hypothetical protein